jgi:isoquinoline 1-oxidoreductase alpha subunit
MQAASFLAQNSNPSDADIVDAMSGNLCRCMAYTRIKKAIKMAASADSLAVNVGPEAAHV